MKKILLYAGLLCSLVIALAACSFSNPEENTQDGDVANNNSDSAIRNELKIGLDVDATKLDPRLASDSTSKRITEMVYSGLVQINSDLEPVPDLALSWENPDDLTWIFKLRDDVTFHDGEKLTAEDVKYTFETILDPNFKSNSYALFSSIESVDVVDETTVQFNLKQPFSPLLSNLNIGIVPKHIAESIPEGLVTNPVGSGPYKFVKWDKNSKIELEAYDGYFGDQPKTNKITYFIIPDHSTRVASLEAGDVDLVHSPLSASDVERMKDNKQFTMVEMDGLGFTYLNFNMNDPVISDIKVRQALAHFVNKKVISETIYRNMDKPGKSPLLPASWAYTEDVPTFGYDVEKGKALLEEAGYSYSEKDGFVDKDGNKLTIELATHTEDPNRIQTVEYLQNEFSKNGIQTSVSTTEWSTFSNNMMEGKYQVALLGWLNLVDPDRATYNQFHSQSGNNYGKYSNPKVDELLEKARSISDQNERKALYQEIASIVNEEVAYDVVLYQGYVVIHSNKLKGFEPQATGSLINLVNATVEK